MAKEVSLKTQCKHLKRDIVHLLSRLRNLGEDFRTEEGKDGITAEIEACTDVIELCVSVIAENHSIRSKLMIAQLEDARRGMRV